MIHHISIAVMNPLRVAEVLAEILEGQVLSAPPKFPKDSRIVFPGDEHGTLIEFATPEMSAQYVGLLTNPEALRAAMAELNAN